MQEKLAERDSTLCAEACRVLNKFPDRQAESRDFSEIVEALAGVAITENFLRNSRWKYNIVISDTVGLGESVGGWTPEQFDFFTSCISPNAKGLCHL